MTTKIGISLGWNCNSAMHGVEYGIRTRKESGYNTCPFDKMLSNFNGIVDCIKDDFAYFTDEKYLSINAENPADPCIMNTKYKFGFNHESLGHADLYIKEKWPKGIAHFICDQYKNFKIRYQNRINNFRNYLTDPNNHITFIITTWDKTEEDMKPLKAALAIKYPNLSYEFIILNDPNGEDYFLRHMHSLGCKIDEPEIKSLLHLPQLNTNSVITPNKIKNFVIGVHMSFYDGGGGCVVQFHLANLLRQRGFNVRVLMGSEYAMSEWTSPPYLAPPNVMFTHADTDRPNDIDVSSNETIVIYCEGILGNPLGGKNVVRWLLSNVEEKRTCSFGKEEVVYYFNNEPKHTKEPAKCGSIYKLFPLIYFNPNVRQYNHQPRNSTCYTYRKSDLHEYLHEIHPNGSTEVVFTNEHDIIINTFNEYKIFYCYDPLTWLAFMAPVCGCATILHPVAGLDKRTWLSNTALNIYMKERNIEDIYGIGYGLPELQYALDTCHLAKKQWDDMQHYFNVTCLDKFIEDMNNFHDLNNRVGNNFA